MQIYWNKRKRLHKKRVQLPEDWFGTPTWPPWRHVKALHSNAVTKRIEHSRGKEKFSLATVFPPKLLLCSCRFLRTLQQNRVHSRLLYFLYFHSFNNQRTSIEKENGLHLSSFSHRLPQADCILECLTLWAHKGIKNKLEDILSWKKWISNKIVNSYRNSWQFFARILFHCYGKFGR